MQQWRDRTGKWLLGGKRCKPWAGQKSPLETKRLLGKNITWHLWQTWMLQIVSRFTAVERKTALTCLHGIHTLKQKQFRNIPGISFCNIKDSSKRCVHKHRCGTTACVHKQHNAGETSESKLTNIQVAYLLNPHTRWRERHKVVVWFFTARHLAQKFLQKFLHA